MIELRSGAARLQVLPEYGGRIHQLWVAVDGREEPLLVAPEDPAAYGESPLGGGCYPMAPWPNRIAGARFPWAGRTIDLRANDGANALHGLVFDRPWEVIARAGPRVELRCDLGEHWPWDGYAWQRIELSAAGLLVKLEVRSRREAFPAGVGLHPWFRRDAAGAEHVRVRVPASERYMLRDQIPTGERVIPAGDFDLREPGPIGERRLDDCYTGLTGPSVIDWGRVQLEMTIECPEPHVMIYTPENAICIEPQTCAPDALNLRTSSERTGLALAEPGRAVSLISRWSWRIM